ncbi:MAG TPA: response regulator [Leptospiraceae bacterium]|nr:response regulator [Leptospiraceae bacterium]
MNENIEIFNNGQDAIEFLKENTDKEEILPEIIFLDLSMPILDGWGFLDEYLFIKPKLNKKIELFILSSSVSPHDVERAKKNLDVSDFIIKPMSKKGFIHIIEQM